VVDAGGGAGGGARPDHPALAVQHLQGGALGVGRQFVAPGGLAVLEPDRRPGGGGVAADVLGGVAQAAGLVGLQQGGQQVVGQQLLLDPGHLGQLGGELVGVHRRQRVLVLQLRGQQRQEGLEIARQHGAAGIHPVDRLAGGNGIDHGQTFISTPSGVSVRERHRTGARAAASSGSAFRRPAPAKARSSRPSQPLRSEPGSRSAKSRASSDRVKPASCSSRRSSSARPRRSVAAAGLSKASRAARRPSASISTDTSTRPRPSGDRAMSNRVERPSSRRTIWAAIRAVVSIVARARVGAVAAARTAAAAVSAGRTGSAGAPSPSMISGASCAASSAGGGGASNRGAPAAGSAATGLAEAAGLGAAAGLPLVAVAALAAVSAAGPNRAGFTRAWRSSRRWPVSAAAAWRSWSRTVSP